MFTTPESCRNFFVFVTSGTIQAHISAEEITGVLFGNKYLSWIHSFFIPIYLAAIVGYFKEISQHSFWVTRTMIKSRTPFWGGGVSSPNSCYLRERERKSVWRISTWIATSLSLPLANNFPDLKLQTTDGVHNVWTPVQPRFCYGWKHMYVLMIN